MTVEGALDEYAATISALRADTINHRRGLSCAVCDWIELQIEAASLTYDLQVAEASLKRVRESVPW